MEQLAHFYVNVVEPAAKFFAFFLAVLAVLWFINMARDPGKQMDIAMNTFNVILQWTIKALTALTLGLWYGFNMIIRAFRITLAILRDFFISKI